MAPGQRNVRGLRLPSWGQPPAPQPRRHCFESRHIGLANSGRSKPGRVVILDGDQWLLSSRDNRGFRDPPAGYPARRNRKSRLAAVYLPTVGCSLISSGIVLRPLPPRAEPIRVAVKSTGQSYGLTLVRRAMAICTGKRFRLQLPFMHSRPEQVSGPILLDDMP